jgi:hypothetical protein
MTDVAPMVTNLNRGGTVPAENLPSLNRAVLSTIAISCFVYLLLRPVSANEVLIPTLFTIGLISAFVGVFGRRRIAPGFVPIWICQAAFALLGTTIGAIMEAPGLQYGVLVYVAAPILFWSCVWAIDLATLRLVLRWLAIGTSVLSTVIIVFVAGEKGLIPQIIPAQILDASGAALGNTFDLTTRIRFYGLSTLAAAGPLWAASLFVRADKLMPHWGWRVYAASSSVVAALLGGRRAIIIAIVLAPIVLRLCAALVRWPRASGVRFGAAIAPLAMVALLFGAGYALAPSLVSFSSVSSAFSDAQALIFGGDETAALQQDIRILEGQELLNGWSGSPIIGHGFGATLNGFDRDPNRPWNFELQYHLILFQTGVIGILIGFLALLFTLRQLRTAARATPQFASTLLVTTAGAASVLVANAIDPYLQAPGHMWAIYLPLAVANIMLLSSTRRPSLGP